MIDKKIFSFVFILLFFFIGCKTTNPVTPPTLNEAVSTKMQELISTHQLPGLNFSVIYPKGQQADYTVGMANVVQQTPLSTEHLFFSGSIGKTYAVALLMQLVDEGKVDLDRKFKTYFPEVDWLTRLPNIEAITVEHLLQHRSGLPRWIMKIECWETLHEQPDKVWSYKDRLAYVFNEKPVHEAGKGWAYSDTNYLLIGMLIEKITGEYYYDLVQDKLLKPLNLATTFPSEKRKIPNLAMGYSKLPEAFKIPNEVIQNGKYCFNPQVEWTGGGMNSTTADLAKWAKYYYEGKTFSQKQLKAITTINPNGIKVMGTNSYGMGSFIYHTQHGDVYGHSGFMPGYNSLFAYFPKARIAVALQSNADYADSDMGLVNALEILYPLL